MHKHIVLDLETLGTDAGAAIIEIGAVAFGGPAPDMHFVKLVSPRKIESKGFHISEDTVTWWKQQGFYLPEYADSVGAEVRDALLMFSAWYDAVATDETLIWGNSPSFDCVILNKALALVDLPELWAYSQERDLRTARWMFPVDKTKPETPHRALDDAIAEAEDLKKILARRGL